LLLAPLHALAASSTAATPPVATIHSQRVSASSAFTQAYASALAVSLGREVG
jgi:hypothetical protein